MNNQNSGGNFVICRKCGAEINSSERFCGECGTLRNTNSPYQQQSDNTNIPIWNWRYWEGKNKVAIAIKMIAIIAGIIVVFIGLYFGYEGSSGWMGGRIFNWPIILIIWGGDFIVCLFIYALGEIIGLLQKIANNTNVLTKL